MKPPGATGAGDSAKAAEPHPAVSVCLETLTKRPEFLAAARALRRGTPGFGLQARNRQDDSPTIRIGYTCSKKVGNAVARNRAKRRLREVARKVLPGAGHSCWDYVLIGRPETTATLPFETLCADLTRALEQIHANRAKHGAPG